LGDDEDWSGGVCDDSGRDTALQMSQQPAAAVRAEHNQARGVLDGGLHDALPGWRRFDGDAPRQEPCLARKRRPVVGGPLSASPYVGGLVGVELIPVGRRESDIDWLPYAHHQRVSPGRQLGRGLRDRVGSEFGPVVGEEHRPDRGRGVTVIRCRVAWRILGHGSRGRQA
jgi:hypothetical protein